MVTAFAILAMFVMYLSQITKCICLRLHNVFVSHFKMCFFLKLQNVFISKCKMYRFQMAKSVCYLMCVENIICLILQVYMWHSCVKGNHFWKIYDEIFCAQTYSCLVFVLYITFIYIAKPDSIGKCVSCAFLLQPMIHSVQTISTNIFEGLSY